MNGFFWIDEDEWIDGLVSEMLYGNACESMDE